MFKLLFIIPTVIATKEEWQKLVRHPNTPCEGHPSQWNCNQIYGREFYESLGKTEKYGWHSGENRGNRDLTDLWDRGYNHTLSIPKFASDYMVLDFPEELWEVVNWYVKSRKNSIQNHDLVAGHYINDADSPLSKLSLDIGANAHIRTLIKTVVKPMLAAWVDEDESNLIFTSLFGVREYHKDSMMILHADRHTTHHISAVVHIFQKGMKDGWPLAVQTGEYVTEIFCAKPCLIFYVSLFSLLTRLLLHL